MHSHRHTRKERFKWKIRRSFKASCSIQCFVQLDLIIRANINPTYVRDFLFVWVLTSLLNIWGHTTRLLLVAVVLWPMCCHTEMPSRKDMTPYPITVYRHGADLSLCYPLMWNVTLEYTATHFNVLGETWPGNPSPTFHTQQRTLNFMLLWWLTVGSSVESTVPTGSWTRDLWCANPLRDPLAHRDFLYMRDIL